MELSITIRKNFRLIVNLLQHENGEIRFFQLADSRFHLSAAQNTHDPNDCVRFDSGHTLGAFARLQSQPLEQSASNRKKTAIPCATGSKRSWLRTQLPRPAEQRLSAILEKSTCRFPNSEL